MDSAESEVGALHEAWREAITHGDLERALGLLTEDYVLWPAGAPAVAGRDTVRALLGTALTQYRITPAFESEERIVSGDIAFERGWDVQVIEPREDGDSMTQRQRVFLVLRRGADGRWRYARGMSQPSPPPE